MRATLRNWEAYVLLRRIERKESKGKKEGKRGTDTRHSPWVGGCWEKETAHPPPKVPFRKGNVPGDVRPRGRRIKGRTNSCISRENQEEV